MGILDDAIREHLELKRAHGAPEEEVRQKEAEAFGPVRHEAAPAAAPAATEMPLDEAVLGAHTQILEPDDQPQPAPEDPYAVDAPARERQDVREDYTPAAEAGAGMLEPHQVEPGPPGPAAHHEDEQHPALIDHDHIGGEEHAPEPVFGHAAPEAPAPHPQPPDAPLQPAPEDPYVGDPAVEDPAIDEPPPRQSPEEAHHEDEDVLEETPEFLQDAPEHDRLWFEQKPPRDFDFGE